ncbi:4'-phosphopantetheinyl transferase superfamily protein [Streptomyces sp. NPDC093801]|uniref:4'-phosphopantetheinyl transferase family protein n=1 Tax=Streptomyces sp. NPDC093801 TaxID=3155203 RepID=UPI00344D9DBA
MDTLFRPLVPGRVHRWGGAGLLVARRPDLTHLPLCLSAAEQRVARALPAWRRSGWMAGRLLAKRLAGELVGAPAREVEVLPRDDGSPHLLVGGRPLPSLHVSVSHTPGHAAAALAPEPVGVDLCETAPADTVHRAAHHAFSPRELSLIGTDRGTDRDEALAGAWALKEAAVKADRSGPFGGAPHRIPLLGLRPPALGGPRRAMAWRAGDVVVALVLAHA